MSGKKIPVVTIDTGVPIPERASYPIEALEVGDSFLFPVNRRPSVQSKASKVKAETGKEFTIARQDEKNCRIWRIK